MPTTRSNIPTMAGKSMSPVKKPSMSNLNPHTITSPLPPPPPPPPLLLATPRKHSLLPVVPSTPTSASALRQRFLREVTNISPTRLRTSPVKSPVKGQEPLPPIVKETLEIGRNGFYFSCEIPLSKVSPRKSTTSSSLRKGDVRGEVGGTGSPCKTVSRQRNEGPTPVRRSERKPRKRDSGSGGINLMAARVEKPVLSTPGRRSSGGSANSVRVEKGVSTPVRRIDRPKRRVSGERYQAVVSEQNERVLRAVKSTSRLARSGPSVRAWRA